jgi:hypothetical protein
MWGITTIDEVVEVCDAAALKERRRLSLIEAGEPLALP